MSDRESSKQADHIVGYRQQKATRFAAGNSGNPNRRPKGSKNLSTLSAEELARTVTLTENGKRKKMPKRRALAKQVVNGAMGNDTKLVALVFDDIRRRERLAPAQQVKMTMEEFEAIAKRVASEI
jgi:Family of unknown function (DUF5681)